MITETQVSEACRAYYAMEKELFGKGGARGCIRDAMREALEASERAADHYAAPAPVQMKEGEV